MNFRLVKMPKFVRWIYPKRVWAFSKNTNLVYLTFDDGPIPEVTPWVLDELKKHNAKATFFCIGENIQKHPEIFQRILNEGHSVGNHTFNHLNGAKTETSVYVENVLKWERSRESEVGSREMEDGSRKSGDGSRESGVGSRETEDGRPKTEETPLDTQSKIVNHQSLIVNLFRPPYGKLTSAQAKLLREKGFKIIMWSLLSYDFDQNISEEKCLQNVVKNIGPGRIVIFHDSLKAEKNLRFVLPKVLEYLGGKGWRCEALGFSNFLV